MTDADVDGAHIRTLVADAAVPRDAGADRGRLRLHRQAAALQAQAGHAASATSRRSPSSRRSCSPTSSRSSRSSTATARPFKLTEARWQRFARLLKQYEGWASALRAEHGHDVVQLPRGVARPRRAGRRRRGGARAARAATAARASRYATELARPRTDELVRRGGRAQDRPRAHAPAAARAVRAPTSTASSSRVHAQLVELAGTPPFAVRARRRDATTALSFEELRRAVIERRRRRASSSSASRASAR